MRTFANSLLLMCFVTRVWSFHAAGSIPNHHGHHGTLRLRQQKFLSPQPSWRSKQWRSRENLSRNNGGATLSSTTALSMVAPAAGLSPVALTYMSLLALQFGLQPIVTRAFAPKTICRSTVVMMQEVAKLITSAALLAGSGAWHSSVAGWSVKTWSMVAGIPAGLYVIQNYLSLIAYQNLTPVTYNVLNQTKTLSAALFCFLFMGRLQSRLQIVALFVLSMAALVLEKVLPLPWAGKSSSSKATVLASTTEESSSEGNDRMHLMSGVLPVLAASAISGMTGAICQKTLQSGRNSFLMTMEISSFSVMFLALSMLVSEDGKKIRRDGFWKGWSYQTWIPVLSNAAGGIIVGLVTKHAGSVQKGFALIFGLLLSGLFQARNTGISSEQIVGGMLAALSLWMHSKFPAAVLI
mmetsp:Transcript_3070/g.5031  ORF Transcript_3070/g.5031 Transcript_3070/m.5031 type:complete len:409 (+) Transcript_3070:96-1322(+)